MTGCFLFPSPAAFSSSRTPPSPPPCSISCTNHMVTAPSNLWGRVCKCVFLSSDLQIVPFIAFVTVKIKVPGWPALQITESALGTAAGWEPMEGSEPCSRVCLCVHTHTFPVCSVNLCLRTESWGPGIAILNHWSSLSQMVTPSSRLSSGIPLLILEVGG